MIVGGLLLALSLSLDQFAAALALGISVLPRHRWARKASVFSAFSTIMPGWGCWLAELSLPAWAPWRRTWRAAS